MNQVRQIPENPVTQIDSKISMDESQAAVSRPRRRPLMARNELLTVAPTVVVLLIIELCRALGFTFPVPYLILYICVMIAGTLGGTRAGALCGLLTGLHIGIASMLGIGSDALTGTIVSTVGAGLIYLLTGFSLGRICDRKERLNQELVQLKNGLEREVAQRTKHLLETQKSLEETEAKLRDINKHQERELARKVEDYRVSEARLNSVFNTMVDGLFVVNSHGEVEDFNPAAVEQFGYPKSEAVGCAIEDLIPGLTRRGEEGRNEFCYGAENLIGRSTEFEGCHKNGTRFPIQLSVGELLLGNKRAYTGLVHDISYQKESEQRLMDAIEKSQTAARAKSEFLANMSHEIRTPLNGVIGMLELIKGTSLSKRQSELLNTAKASANRLLNVISDILDYSRIETSGLKISNEVFDLQQAVEDAVILGSSEAAIRGVELNCYVPFDVPRTLVGDNFRLKQVIENLLSNAVKFTRDGEVNVTVFKQAESENNVSLRFEVQDTGIGIDPLKIETLFDAFAQEDSSVTREHGGTGLGLTIARELVRLMGGRIGASSELGEGSTFWFEIGFERDSQTEEESSPEWPDGFRVLVADDNRTNREILSNYLTGWNIASDCVDDGQSALARMRESLDENRPYSAVILDSNMPGMNGLAVAHELIAEQAFPATRIIILSSANDSEERFRNAGIHNYLDKPARQMDIFSMLQRSLTAGDEQSERSHAAYSYGRRSSDVKISDARVLVVDDVMTNQLACREMLRALGASCEIATNGEEAQQAVMSGRYDLVLMDCQMPEINGLEATRSIRHWEKTNGKPRMPVLAVTAYPMDEDRQSCLQAGMDDYLTKPFSIADLARLLTQWLPANKLERSRLRGFSKGPNVRDDQDLELDDIFDMEVLEGLRKRKSNALASIVQSFTEHVAKLLPQLRDSVTKSDFTGIQNAAHALKEAAIGVAAARLVELCETLELQALGLSLDEPQRQTDEIEAEYDRARSALEQLV